MPSTTLPVPRFPGRARRAVLARVVLTGAVAIGILAAQPVFSAAETTAVAAVIAPGVSATALVGASAESSATTNTPPPTTVETPTPTALFVRGQKTAVSINLPAQPANLIAVGFHQASNKKAYRLVPMGSCIRIYRPSKTKGLLRRVSGLKMFQQALRGRGSSNFSAADVAVLPKSEVLAASSGTVTMVKRYKLYGVYTDYQLEIQPDGSPNLRVVMLHIQDMRVKVGDTVVGGVTPVATVRHFKFTSAVNRYLPVKRADHTHIQINNRTYKKMGS